MHRSVQIEKQKQQKHQLFAPLPRMPKTDESPLAQFHAERLVDQTSYSFDIYDDRMIGKGDNKIICMSFEADTFFSYDLSNLTFFLSNEESQGQEVFVLPNEKTFFLGQNMLRLTCPQRGFFELYETLQELGKGKNSQVCKVVRKKDQCILACKIQKNSSNYEKEIKILRELKHPNLTYFHQFFIQNDHKTYTILDFEDGGNLLSFIQGSVEVPEKLKIKIVKDLLNGLEYLRVKGIVHRDLKPENILFSQTDGNFKIADFGLAISVNSKFQKVVGTPGYIAPEILQGNLSEAAFDSDIYSMGLIFYEVFTGKQYYEGKSSSELLQKNLKGLSRKKRHNNGFQLKALEKDLLDKMIRSNRQNRKSSCEILASGTFNKLTKIYGVDSRSSGSTKNKQTDESDLQGGSLMGTVKKFFKLRNSG